MMYGNHSACLGWFLLNEPDVRPLIKFPPVLSVGRCPATAGFDPCSAPCRTADGTTASYYAREEPQRPYSATLEPCSCMEPTPVVCAQPVLHAQGMDGSAGLLPIMHLSRLELTAC